MSTIRLHVIDYDKLGLTWNIDVYYKRNKIETLNRNEFEELDGLFGFASNLLKRRYNIKFSPGGFCKPNLPFEVNCYYYNSVKFDNLRHLLEQEFEDTINEDIVRQTMHEKENLEKFIEYSSQDQVDEYLNSLNEDNTLTFKLQELNLEKKIDLKFIKNIELVIEESLRQAYERKERHPEFYEDYDSVSSRRFRTTVAFVPKFESMMKKIEEMQNVL